MISPSLVKNMFGVVLLFISLALTSCGPDAAPPATGVPSPSGSRAASESLPAQAQTRQPSVVSQAELAKIFDDSATTLLELKTTEQFSEVKMNADAVLVPGSDGLAIKVTTNDPVLFLPAFAAGKQFILKVIIESPAPTGMQLFYMLRDAPNYTEPHSQSLPLQKGRNVVYFRVNQTNVIDPVRLDPAYNAGDYKIESITARELAKPTAQ